MAVKRSKAQSPPAFGGFPQELLEYLERLERNNTREWFEAHRDDYETLWVTPAKAFAEAMGKALGRVDKGVRAEPRINGSIMRINRDTRFSKDKRPYKTALHFIFAGGSGPLKQAPGYFLRIGPQEIGLAGGIMGFDDAQLKRYRAAVVDPKLGRSLRDAVEKVRKAGPYELGEPHWKRVPKGLDAEHPNADYLRRRGLGAHGTLPLSKELLGKNAVDFCIDRFTELRPIPRWLAKALG